MAPRKHPFSPARAPLFVGILTGLGIAAAVADDVVTGEVITGEVVEGDGSNGEVPDHVADVVFRDYDQGGDLTFQFGGLSLDALTDVDSDEYVTERFIRPGYSEPSGQFVPFRAVQKLGRGIRFTVDSGVGYDTNTLLTDGGYSSPTHVERGDRGGFVSWFRFNLGYNFGYGGGYSGGTGRDGKGVIFGFNLGGNVFAYESSHHEFGRGNYEPSFQPYVGILGAKTQVYLTGYYDFTEGNYLSSSFVRREAPVAEAHQWGFEVDVKRQLDRGTLNYGYSFREYDFDADTLLNDQSSSIHDVSYLHSPVNLPKTQLGAGVRFGTYNTNRNPESDFVEPSFRGSYKPTQKTRLHGRVGYAFRDFMGVNAISNNEGAFTYALGADWTATQRIRWSVDAYREFQPSVVSAGESFDTDGVKLRMNYAVPFGRLNLAADAAYEKAEYGATTVGGMSVRDDEYFRFGVQVGRPINLVRWIDTSVVLFYDYSQNVSNDTLAEFDRHFSGVRLTGSL